MCVKMLNGTNLKGACAPLCVRHDQKQGAFPESHVRHVYLSWLIPRIFHSKYVCVEKGLKGSVKPHTHKLAIFCRLIPIFLWVGSLPALARGGMLCQLVID